MMMFFKNLSKHLFLPLIVIMLLAGAGCKSKKKAMEAEAAEKARMEQETADKKKKEEEEARRKQEEAAELDRQRKEREAAEARESAPSMKLEDYFNAIAGASSPTAANATIEEALALFATADAPVLIVIAESGGVKDYDRPTTIRAYMNYLKDVKKNTNRIGNLQFDNSNKIVEVELIKGR